MAVPFDFPPALGLLSANGVRFRELTESGMPAWFKRATDAETTDLAGDPVPASTAAGAVWLQRHREPVAPKTGLRWAIEVEDAGSVGTVRLNFNATNMAVADLGIVIARSAWGQGIGSTAARLVTEYVLTQLGLAEIHAELLQRNHASQYLLQKLGFTLAQIRPPSADEPETPLRFQLGRAPQLQLTERV